MSKTVNFLRGWTALTVTGLFPERDAQSVRAAESTFLGIGVAGQQQISLPGSHLLGGAASAVGRAGQMYNL